MNSPTCDTQTTLLTSHKGVDLHAASALLVMQDRLEGGDLLVNLFRCELHTFWGAPDGWDVARMLNTGRFFNPNKHHFGVFAGPVDGPNWLTGAVDQRLSGGWPGPVQNTDLAALQADSSALYESLLGGPVGEGCTPFDVVSFTHGQVGPVLSGVVWRLVIRGPAEEAAMVGETLAVARHRKQGLLINPHMDSWIAVGG